MMMDEPIDPFAELKGWSVTEDDLAAEPDERNRWIYSDDGLVGSVRINVSGDRSACVYGNFDADDVRKVVPFYLAGYRCRSDNSLRARLGGAPFDSIPRLILDVDNPRLRIRHLNGNRFDYRRSNLQVYNQGDVRRISYGPGWAVIRVLVRERSGGVCEICHRRPAIDVHHCLPVRFFARPADAHFLSNLRDVCKPCHRREHRMIAQKWPLFNALTFYRQGSCALAAPGTVSRLAHEGQIGELSL